MQIRVPSKRVREKFLIKYELQGCQKAVDFLTEYYGVRGMRIILDGRRVGRRKANGWVACYLDNKTFLTKKGLSKRVVLHELCHHLINTKGLEIPFRKEEKQANFYTREFLKTKHLKL